MRGSFYCGMIEWPSCLACKSSFSVCRSVLTRILPWGVPGPPLLRNRGPVRTLGGQSYSRSMTDVEKIRRDLSPFHFIKARSKGNSCNGGPSAEITIRVSNLSACSLFL